VYVRHKVSHFVVVKIEQMELVFHARNLSEVVKVRHILAPRGAQVVLHTLQTPQKVEDFQQVIHHFFSEDCREGCQVIYSIIKLEDFPPFVSWGVFEELDV
jgi:hypothetical protein